MENSIQLKPISELLGKNFFIPSYQRGYRWTQQQVEDLLNDIYAFSIKDKQRDKDNSIKEFYCLQPIVVKPHVWKRETPNKTSEIVNGWEVVDGQQRLTTIKILFIYLIQKHLNNVPLKEEYEEDLYEIDYETRGSFFGNITDINIENIDSFFISSAYQHIKNWFENQKGQKGIRESIIRTLVHNSQNQKVEGIVKVIWYQIEGNENPIDTFMRINMGKIPLTNSELIKALFLQKRNFGSHEVAERKQIEIANEWDKIENTLQNEDFWWFLNKGENKIPAKIEFLFDTIFNIAKNEAQENGTLNDFEKEYGTDRHATFRYFNVKFNNNLTSEIIKEEWDTIKDYFLSFEEWFNNPIWYHYIGYLIYCGTDIVELYNEFKGKAKTKFTETLISLIRKELKDTIKKKQVDKEVIYEINLNYKDKKAKLRQFFLLLNIEFIIKQYTILENGNRKIKEGSSNAVFIKFPFQLFKNINWEIEHVDSFTEKELNESEQIQWLKAALLDSDDSQPLYQELKTQIDNFIKKEPKRRTFVELRTDIQKEIGELKNDEETKHSIGNLTLLEDVINRGYGNALFITKRRIIIEKDKEGFFIPICTKYVFLKYFNEKGSTLTKWTKTDIENHQNFIGKTLDNFSTSK